MRRLTTILAMMTLAVGARAGYDFNPDWSTTGVIGEGHGDAAITIGDVNGDGFSDVAVGAPDYGSSPAYSRGKVAVYYGGPDGLTEGPYWNWIGDTGNSRFGQEIAPAGDMNGDGIDDFVVAAPYLSNGHSEEGRLYFFMGGTSGPTLLTTAEINEEDAHLGWSVDFAGDVNGDGYDDVIAGAPGWGGYGSPFYVPVQGAAYIYYGGPSGPDGTADWSKGGGDTDADFGWSVAGLGDVNGDGYSDVMVGQPGYDAGLFGNDRGQAHGFYGAEAGPSTTADWYNIGTYNDDRFGSNVAWVGDFNGDGFADALFGVRYYGNSVGAVYIASGGPSGLGGAALLRTGNGLGSDWGESVAGIGDWNGDGLTDFTVSGSVNHDVTVYFGGGLPYLKSVIIGSGLFGDILGGAGDINGDGMCDFVISDPLAANGAGTVYLYEGGPEIDYTPPLAESRVGTSNVFLSYGFGGAGDVIGDGIGDLVVGAPTTGTTGEVQLYYGDTFGLSATPDWTDLGDGPNSRLGISADGAGDVNGDGYADFVVGDQVNQEVRVYYGSASGPQASYWSYTFTEQADAGFGIGVCGGGDLNGDGFADIAVGAESWDGDDIDEGMVRVFFGSAQGMQSGGYVDLDPGSADTYLGAELDIIGDFDGDGLDDLVVGIPNYSYDPGNYAGAFVLYFGDPTGIAAAWIMSIGGGSVGELGASVAAAGDVNGDGFADFIIGRPGSNAFGADSGRVHVYLGGQRGVGDRIDIDGPELANARFGSAVTGIGDYDGQGRSCVAATWKSTQTSISVYELDPGVQQTASVGLGTIGSAIGLAPVGDLDGDGFPEIGVSMPFDDGATGQWRTYGPFGTWEALAYAPEPHLTTTMGEPIALRGAVDGAASPRFHLNSWAPAGRTRMRLEWQVGTERQAYDQSGAGPWTPSATHIAGTPVTADPMLSLMGGERYRWHIRAAAANPYQPHGPWLTSQPNSETLYGFRLLPYVAPVPDDMPSRGDAMVRAVPNPFNPTTRFAFTLPGHEDVDLNVYDASGRLVRVLHQGPLAAGPHRITWNGRDDAGSTLASGIYFALLRTDSGSSRLKVTLLK